MPNYKELLGNLNKAEEHCRKAEEALVPMVKVKQVDAYLLGLLQSMRLILNDAKKAALAASKTTKTIQE